MVPSEGPIPAKIMLVGEYPGEREIQENRPFVGPSGWELDKMLGSAGINRLNCFVTNVVRERPRGNDISIWIPDTKKGVTKEHSILLRDRFVAPIVFEGFKLLVDEIERCKPEVIIALGNIALWALTGRWGIKSWRGSMLEVDTEELKKWVNINTGLPRK